MYNESACHSSVFRVAASTSVEVSVQIECCTDEGDVRERLWKIAQHSTVQASLFGVEANVVSVAKHVLGRKVSNKTHKHSYGITHLKDESCLLQQLWVVMTSSSHRFDKPKGADIERAERN